MRIIDLQVMLWHFYNPASYPERSKSAISAHERCLEEGLIEEKLSSRVINEHASLEQVPPANREYTITEKGRVFVNALMSVPLPVMAYVMPKPDERAHGQ